MSKIAKFVIYKNKDKFRLERGYIRKGTRQIVSAKTKYFKTRKEANDFGKKWLKNR